MILPGSPSACIAQSNTPFCALHAFLEGQYMNTLHPTADIIRMGVVGTVEAIPCQLLPELPPPSSIGCYLHTPATWYAGE